MKSIVKLSSKFLYETSVVGKLAESTASTKWMETFDTEKRIGKTFSSCHTHAAVKIDCKH